MPDKKKAQPADGGSTPVVETTINVEEITAREAQRINDILIAGDNYAQFGGVEIARELVKDKSATVDTLNARVLASMDANKSPETSQAQPATFPSDTRIMAGSMMHGQLRAFTRDLPLQDGTVMKREEAAYRAGMWMAATIYNNEKAKRWCNERGIDVTQRVMSGNTESGGGAIVPPEMEQAIIDLRVQYGVARRLARRRPMGSDSLNVPRRTGGVTAYFFDDASGTGPTANDKSWDNVGLNAKSVGALTKVGSSLVEDAVIDVVDDLANEFAYAFATKEDECFINGDGTSTYGGMNGLITKFNATAYAGRISLTSGNDTLAEVSATDLALVMAGVASFGKPGAKWLVSPTAKSLIFDRLMAAGGGNTIQTLANGVPPSYLGYEIAESESMPAGAATDYSSSTMFMFGRFDLSSSFGDRRGIMIQVLRERYAELGQIGVMGTERFDLVNHDLGSTSAKGPISAGYGN